MGGFIYDYCSFIIICCKFPGKLEYCDCQLELNLSSFYDDDEVCDELVTLESH